MKSTSRFSSPAFFEPRNNLKLVPMGEETIKIEDGEIRLRGRLRISWGDLKTPRNHLCYLIVYPDNIYLLKVSNRNAKKTCGICSKLTPFSSVSVSLKK